MKLNYILYTVLLTFGVASCTPKVSVLKSPDYKGEIPAGVSNPKSTTNSNGTSSDVSSNGTVNTGNNAKSFSGESISLLLPFQLDKIVAEEVLEKDVKRSALALDFYQGFQFGLQELAKKGKNYQLNVLDSRDNEYQNTVLASSESIKEASLIVGPVYPKEIKAFGSTLINKNVLQINPLAASMPSEFGLSNLVSVTPPIKAHTNAIASEVAREYTTGDVILIYNSSDNDGRQFLSGMLGAIKQIKASVNIITVATIAQLNENLSNTGFTHIIAGTTDKLQIKTLINNLSSKSKEGVYNIQLYGHPLWDRYDWSLYSNFADFSPRISSESTLKGWTAAVKTFKDNYFTKYGVQPSDHSYKGYDSAIFFGTLLGKYGKDHLKENLTKETFEGIYSRYKFKYNEAWGYANEAVAIKIFRNGDFQLQ